MIMIMIMIMIIDEIDRSGFLLVLRPQPNIVQSYKVVKTNTKGTIKNLHLKTYRKTASLV